MYPKVLSRKSRLSVSSTLHIVNTFLCARKISKASKSKQNSTRKERIGQGQRERPNSLSNSKIERERCRYRVSLSFSLIFTLTMQWGCLKKGSISITTATTVGTASRKSVSAIDDLHSEHVLPSEFVFFSLESSSILLVLSYLLIKCSRF